MANEAIKQFQMSPFVLVKAKYENRRYRVEISAAAAFVLVLKACTRLKRSSGEEVPVQLWQVFQNIIRK